MNDNCTKQEGWNMNVRAEKYSIRSVLARRIKYQTSKS